MTLMQGILLALLYYLGNSTWGLGVGWWTLMRPLVLGFLSGVILGDARQGTIVGAQINVLYLGFIGAGGAIPGDIALAGVVGTAIAISANVDVNTAMSLAVPVGILGTVIWVVKLTVNTLWVRVAEKYAAEGDTKKFWIADVALPQLFLFVVSFISCFVIVYYGVTYIKDVLDFLGDNVVGVLSTIGGMLPAVGIALTLKSIFKNESIAMFFLGFMLVQYFHLDIIATGFLSLVLTVIYMQLKSKDNEKPMMDVINDSIEENKSYVLLDKKTIFKSWFRWIMFNQANYNYERMQGTGFCHSMLPIIEKLYPNDKAKRAERMKLQMNFFNTEPQWGACIVGLSAALEEKKAQGAEEISDDMILSIKSSLMGPLAGIGDTIDGGVITPLLLTLFIGISQTGTIAGPIGYIIIEAIIMWSIYWVSYKLGYEKGSEAIVNLLESGKINKIILGASIMGCMVLGGLVGNFVTFQTALSFNLGGETPFLLQEQLFDIILPGMLPLLLTLGCYWLLAKKNVSSIKVILLIFLVGLVGGLLGIII
ncbi:PTS system mannose/fructose/sorbose family transporter subunit IID [Anaerorhabdus sp.]|uniref:PTS system mannose/fructose/sorbose family transporter subunit IID n=1 Tax=Anaerorhabdus sp. TaxID=1872524 RepID=UPI002FCB506B